MLSGDMRWDDYQFFFSDYNQASQIHFFNEVLPRALDRHDDPCWRKYVEHIVEEESSPAPHWALFAEFMSDCGFVLKPPDEPACRYADAILGGYMADLPFAVGYALGLEVEAGYEIAVLSKALVRHFPDQLGRTPWFDAHLADQQEEEHANASVALVESVIAGPSDLERVRAGFVQYCDDVHAFMSAVDDRLPVTRQ
jgi:hypothetical protein